MKSPLITVSQLNQYLKSLIDGDINLNNVFVCGEISNFTNHYRTGHYYMTLKDSGSSIRAVMFKGSNQRLKFMPENAMSVVARGRVSVFERDGQYQLYIDDMQPDGAGALSVAFEQLKAKLEAQGLFDASRKRPLPRYASVIAVVTSPTGAAVRDILSILERRFPLTKVLICPVQVQGASAAPQIAAAIERVSTDKLADLIIVGRGGGSTEELWAFNEEIVARAVAASEVPVISAVGHETDYTICDFVADLRAATPSAAAELAVPDWREERDYLAGNAFRCRAALTESISAGRAHIKALGHLVELNSPRAVLDSRRQTLDGCLTSLNAAMAARMGEMRGALSLKGGSLDAMSPLRVLARGYSITAKNGVPVGSVQNVHSGDAIEITVSDGEISARVEGVKTERSF